MPSVSPSLITLLSLSSLLLACQLGLLHHGVEAQMTYQNCLTYYNNICNVACASRPNNCYYVNIHYLCPCQLKCYSDHCMTGKMTQTCPGCAHATELCRPWHDHIELHSCGNKKLDTREKFRNHCKSWDACVKSCPEAGLCYDDNARPNYANWDIQADMNKVAEVLGTGK